MGFTTKFLLGGVLVGGTSLLYRQRIQSTAAQLHADLVALSDQLTSLSRTAPTPPSAYPPPVPTRLPLVENLKARWNEKMMYGLHALQTTNWPAVAGETWASVKDGAATLQARLTGPTPQAVAAPPPPKLV